MTETSVVHVERSTGALALKADQHDWTPDQAAALRQLGLSDASPADLKVFLHQSQRTGLDPFARQIYMIGRWEKGGGKKYTIQTSIDGLRIVAERHGQYGGQDGPYWCGEDGKWTDVWVSSKPPVAAKIGVRRLDWPQPTYAVAKFDEYAGRNKDGSLTSMWASKPCVMIAKCAEALALRKAFPQDLSGIYTADEMAQADNPPMRMVIDQSTDETEQSQVDWDSEIVACAGDVGKLLKLHARASGNEAAQVKISEAGKKARAAAKAKAEGKPAEPQPEVVDAEIVEDTPAERQRPGVQDVVDALLATSDFELAEASRKEGVSTDVSAFIDDEVRDVLNIPEGPVRLHQLAQKIGNYIKRHGHSVLEGIAKSLGDAA